MDGETITGNSKIEILMCGPNGQCLFDQSSHCLRETVKADGLRQKSIGVR